jgi:hypothetical protein
LRRTGTAGGLRWTGRAGGLKCGARGLRWTGSDTLANDRQSGTRDGRGQDKGNDEGRAEASHVGCASCETEDTPRPEMGADVEGE